MPPLDPSLKSWALPRLSALLGLDDDSLTQLLEYTHSLGPDQGAEHLRNILGDSAKALEFIVGFGERWRKNGTINTSGAGNGGGKKMGGKQQQPQQQQQQQQRQQRQQERQPPSASGPLISEYLPNVRSKTAKPSAAKRQQQGQSSSPSATPSTSTSTSTSTKTNKTKTTTTTSNIADLTAAIAQLELTTNPSLSTSSKDPKAKAKDSKPRKCTCQATLHPLFTPAPNCLNCGKIICALEGLQPCSFCQQPLLSAGQVQEMIRELRAERGGERMRAHNRGVQRAQQHDGPSAGNSAGGDSNGTRDGSDDGDINTMRDLAAAKAHRDKLLHYQAQNARRTKVVDEVAEFETPDVHAGSTLWMSAGQRALALKRQQKVLREMEERGKEEWERGGGGVVVSLSFEGGGAGKKGQRGVLRRVERVEVEGGNGNAEDVVEEEEAEEEEEGKGGFGNNPLLAGGGLVRPVWKGKKGGDGDQSASGSGSGRERRQKQTWRRVQDDDEDNERWILDGGLYGYGNERREMEEE
ncbi:hypothetical protein GX50_07495 [[Emmonsia] crescens]|uniref:TRIP4/RQT4 C2HC5-type zinc finger domain-containing protein n=1 Tax=[Emmonsia] crescens TaxID=73230 RepID=A0A2B7Z8P6_9EURO|nr:hypothetical protein GX50_07495 [Emmonsia crescens]